MNKVLTKAAAQIRLTKLRQLIDRYRYDQHVLDKTTISEAALDSLKHELTLIEQQYPDLITPDSPSQRVAGRPLPGFTKVKHQQRMISLADVFSVEELRAWDERWRKVAPPTKTDYLIDLKLDGLAITIRYDRGLLAQAATRGDGFVGEDVTQNVKTIESIPLKLRTEKLPAEARRLVEAGSVVIRGEAVMLKKDFDRLNKQQTNMSQPVFANPRNVAAGSIRQLDPAISASRKLTFYAWELVTDLGQRKLSEAYECLKLMGIKVNPQSRVGHDLNDLVKFHEAMFARRAGLPFWIDGVVVKLNDRALYQQLGFVGKTPRAAVAWKFTAEQATTIVENIVVQVGRTGALTPVAHLTPVAVAGTTVARATLHNAEEIGRLDVRIGDTVIIQKAGDIIPEVVEVLTKLRPAQVPIWTMPKWCPVCHSPVQKKIGEAISYCSNLKCPARQRESLYHFISKKAFDIKGLGPSTVDVLIEEGLVKEPAEFFHLNKGDLVGLPLIAELKSDNLIAAVNAARHIRLDRFIYGLGIRHVGEQTALDLARQFKTMPNLMKADEGEIGAVPNIGAVVAASLVGWFKLTANQRSIDRLLNEVTVLPPPKVTGGKLSGKSVVVTGMLDTMSRDEAHEAIRRAGGKVVSSVSRKTSYVVVGSDPGSKAEQARKLQVPIIDEAELKKIIG